MADKYERLKEHHEEIILLAHDAYQNIKVGLYTTAARYIQAIVELEKEFQSQEAEDGE